MNSQYEELKVAIDALIEKIYSKFDLYGPIKSLDDMSGIVNKLGGYLNFNEHDPLLHYEVYKVHDAFVIDVQKEKSSAYSYDSDYDENCKKFVIAQAVGNLFLNMHYSYEDNIWNSINNGKACKYGSNCLDSEWINYFAYAFLMPKNKFQQVMNDCVGSNGYINVTRMSKEFYTNKTYIESRGVALGFFKS